jgi:hypothetical protein
MNELRAAFEPVADAFDALHIDYRIGGSVASSLDREQSRSATTTSATFPTRHPKTWSC